jgi:hypothetical protein
MSEVLLALNILSSAAHPAPRRRPDENLRMIFIVRALAAVRPGKPQATVSQEAMRSPKGVVGASASVRRGRSSAAAKTPTDSARIWGALTSSSRIESVEMSWFLPGPAWCRASRRTGKLVGLRSSGTARKILRADAARLPHEFHDHMSDSSRKYRCLNLSERLPWLPSFAPRAFSGKKPALGPDPRMESGFSFENATT